MVTARSYHRLGSRYFTRILVWIVVLSIVVIATLIVRSIVQENPYRTSMVVAGNPVHVVSFDSQRNHAVIIDIPEDTVISATRGYGAYRVGALIGLDRIDKHHGTLLTESVADAVGVPLEAYVNATDFGIGPGTIDTLRSLFSWSRLPQVLFGSVEHSLPLSTWVSLVISVQSLKPNQVQSVDIRQAIIDRSEADGSITHMLDQSRLDYLLDNVMVDTGIREESRTVAVINTTAASGIGQKAARELTRIGIQVVSVGNEENPLADCTVAGASGVLSSKTARFILSYFHCKSVVNDKEADQQVADLILRLGTTYAARFEASR